MNVESPVIQHPTIFALSSGTPPAAIAVVRVSGPGAGLALEAMAGGIPPSRRAALRILRNPADQSVVDQALVLWFPGPKSETGEDMAELQLHGGRAVIAATLEILARLPGYRLAEPGEFTRRAFENGRMDLTGVEGLADLIGAETEAQRRQAVGQAAGALRIRAECWRRQLIEALALTEAQLDFSDERDIEDGGSVLIHRAQAVAAEMAHELQEMLRAPGGEHVRDGIVVAIAGPPNAGKSSLYNLLLRRDAAIVSPHAGTTRDVLEARLDIGGYAVTLLDLAGIRTTTEPIEAEGVRRARERAAEADVVLWVVDATDPVPTDEAPERSWLVSNKIDLLDSAAERSLTLTAPRNERRAAFRVSARTQEGMADLEASIADAAGGRAAVEPALITRTRHRELIGAMHRSLVRAAGQHAQQTELLAEDLRAAVAAVGRLTGRVDAEDVLGAIFGEFCIGK